MNSQEIKATARGCGYIILFFLMIIGLLVAFLFYGDHREIMDETRDKTGIYVLDTKKTKIYNYSEDSINYKNLYLNFLILYKFGES